MGPTGIGWGNGGSWGARTGSVGVLPALASLTSLVRNTKGLNKVSLTQNNSLKMKTMQTCSFQVH